MDEISLVRKINEVKERMSEKEVDIQDLLSNSGWFENRLRVAVRNREKNEKDTDTVRTVCEKPFDDLEEYYYLKLTKEDLTKLGCFPNDDEDDGATIKVCNDILKNYGYKKEWVRAKARYNTKQNLKIESLGAVLTDLMGLPFDDEIEEFHATDDTVWVLSTEDKMLGAVGIIFTDVLKDFATEHNIKTLAVLPSSIHEVLLVRLKNLDEREIYMDMVKEINEAEVQEKERLSDNAYIIQNE